MQAFSKTKKVVSKIKFAFIEVLNFFKKEDDLPIATVTL